MVYSSFVRQNRGFINLGYMKTLFGLKCVPLQIENLQYLFFFYTGYTSFVRPKSGSVYIEQMVDMLLKEAGSCELAKLFTKV